MNFLFWSCFVFDFLVLLVAFWGKGFRSDFGAGTGFNVAVIFLLILLMAGGLLVKYVIKHEIIALVLVGIPILVMLVASVFSRRPG